MNTKPTPDRDAQCAIERVDDENRSYLCCKPTRTVWVAEKDTEVPICSSCLRWLQTLEHLGQKLT